MPSVAEILTAKAEAGDDAFLWAQPDAGDVILWATEAESVDDDGATAIARWHVSESIADALIATGEVNETN